MRSSYYARNIGISAASGQYIIFIDADCILDKDIISGYKKNIKNIDAKIIYAGNILPAVNKGSLIENYSANRLVLNQKSAATGWAYKPFAQTANAMFLRKDLIKIHGFNECMTSGGDAEICWRLTNKFNHKVILCEEAIVYHQHRKTVEDFIAQFMKYGRGRFQQAQASDIFAKTKRPDDFTVFKDRSIKLVDDLVSAGCSEELIFTLLDSYIGFYFNMGFLDELITNFNKSCDGLNYEFISHIKNLKLLNTDNEYEK